ncbi:MAG: TIGR02147 family protein, partial [Bdellovibrionales bacterium]|nr:TIGR02147 family protein [Bdellovibrionales bacterium]
NELKKRKERNPNFSLRAFARWLGISPSQLSQMLTGKRPITLATMKKISHRLDLSPIEHKTLMTSMLADKNFIDTDVQQKKLLLAEDKFRLISDWYHFAILSLTRIKGAESDPRWIARRLGISVEEANQALVRLVRMGIVQTKPTFKQICDPIEMLPDAPSEAVRKYHKQTLNLAAEKIETVPMKQRDYQSLTIPIDPKQVSVIKKYVNDFLEQITQYTEKNKGSEVYNLNLQLFPLTNISEDSE